MSAIGYSNPYKLRQHIQLVARASFDYGKPVAWKCRVNSRLINEIFFIATMIGPRYVAEQVLVVVAFVVKSLISRRKSSGSRCGRYMMLPTRNRCTMCKSRNCGDPLQIQFSRHTRQLEGRAPGLFALSVLCARARSYRINDAATRSYVPWRECSCRWMST